MVSLNTKYQAHAIAKPCNKTRYWQEQWLPNQKVQWNMTSFDTDQVQDLHSRGDFDVCAQLAPH